MPALFSIEINAHSLTYLLLLALEKKITDEALQLTLFNSQICEGYFRTARSMSGSFSTVVNFSVHEFLQRASKLSLLQDIRFASDLNLNNLVFPRHHKLWSRANLPSLASSASLLTEKAIEETVFSAYIEASRILASCNLSILDPTDQMISFDEVNLLASKKLGASKLKTASNQSFDWSSQSREGEEEDEEDEAEEKSQYSHHPGDDNDADCDVPSGDNDECNLSVLSNVSRSTVNGIRIFDAIDDRHRDSFFRVEINGQEKFLHKQAATWYLSTDKAALSSDRLKRVQSK